jgi:Flp pilus assembly pilin Flp
MIQTITNWLRLDAQNYITEVWYAVLILWVALVIIGILSVVSNTLTNQSKTMWIALILCVPLAGLFAYCIFCLTRVEYHLLEFLFRKRKSTLRSNSDLSDQRRQRPA